METGKIGRLCGVALAVALAVSAGGGPAHGAEPVPGPPTPNFQVTGPNAITVENSLPGSTDWKITKPARHYEIAGYIMRPSVESGGSLDVHVNTKGADAGLPYTAEVFRMGDYGGKGARRVAGPDVRPGGPSLRDPYEVDPATGRVEADWPVGFTVDTTGFTSGAFLARLTSASGWQAYVPFTVRSATPTDYLLLQSHLTWQAYNITGGNSLYQWNGAYPNLRTSWCFLWMCQWTWTDPVTGVHKYSGTKPQVKPSAHQVSFRRPYWMPGRYLSTHGSGEFLIYEQPLVQWLESRGFDVGYAADFDLHENPVPAGVKAVILPGHQEYWTGPMRDNAEEAQARGVGLVSFGANQAYWRCRIEGSSPQDVGVYTCYRSANGEPHPSDPLKNDPDLASAQFRSTFVHRPEQTLLGSMFTGWVNANLPAAGLPGTSGHGYLDMKAASDVGNPLFAGTGITAGQAFPGLLGGEFDRVWPNYPSIPNTQKLFSSKIQPREWNGGGSMLNQWFCGLGWVNNCYYGYHDAVVAEKVAPDQVTVSRVFNAGTFNWAWGLKDFAQQSSPPQEFNFAKDEIEALTTNVLLWAAKIT